MAQALGAAGFGALARAQAAGAAGRPGGRAAGRARGGYAAELRGVKSPTPTAPGWDRSRGFSNHFCDTVGKVSLLCGGLVFGQPLLFAPLL